MSVLYKFTLDVDGLGLSVLDVEKESPRRYTLSSHQSIVEIGRYFSKSNLGIVRYDKYKSGSVYCVLTEPDEEYALRVLKDGLEARLLDKIQRLRHKLWEKETLLEKVRGF